MSTTKQVAANIENASLSTGPTTVPGMAASSMNAAKHGLAASPQRVLRGEDYEYAARYTEWFEQYQPQTAEGIFALKRMVIASLRLLRCEEEFHHLRSSRNLQAEWNWEEDGNIEAQKLFKKLASNPGLVTLELENSFYGCQLKLKMWHWIERTAVANQGLNEKERSNALDLLGIPHDYRQLPTLVDAPEGAEKPGIAIMFQIHKEVDRLKDRLRNGLSVINQDRRNKTFSGISVYDSPGGRRLQRYERFWDRIFREAKKQLREAEAPPDLEKESPESPASTQRRTAKPARIPAKQSVTTYSGPNSIDNDDDDDDDDEIIENSPEGLRRLVERFDSRFEHAESFRPPGV